MRRFQQLSVLAAIFVVTGVLRTHAATPTACEDLSKLTLSQTKITLAQVVAAGTFVSPVPPGPGVAPGNFQDVPAFCRVIADLSPSTDSDIKVEVWMPASGWNGRFQGQGNGGFAGQIGYAGMAAVVKRGYATAGTDTGHTGNALQAEWALGHPEKVADFGYRAIHEMTLKAKAIIDAYYGQNPRYSYFLSCSGGGREALMEAQRFPADYNGIVAGAPANYWTHLFAAFAWDEQALLENSESYIPSAKLPAISAAVLAACDARDGLKDGLLDDPRQCNFDANTLLCKAAETDACLTAAQVDTLKKLYAGPTDAKGDSIYGGLMPGFEEGWGPWVVGRAPGQALVDGFAVQYFSNMVYGNAKWELKSFSLDGSVAQFDAVSARRLNATDPNLKPFRSHGGKLMMYQGWNDPATPPLNSINYYQSVVAKMGQRRAASFLRLFMVPGMGHCGGGPGPSYFGQDANAKDRDSEHDIYAAIEAWVEKDVAPARIIATKFANDSRAEGPAEMTRPLCPYPQIAKYDGTGNPNDAASFTCALPKP